MCSWLLTSLLAFLTIDFSICKIKMEVILISCEKHDGQEQGGEEMVYFSFGPSLRETNAGTQAEAWSKNQWGSTAYWLASVGLLS